jgi:predicted nucleotidyltransferase
VRGAASDWRLLASGEREWLIGHWQLIRDLRGALRNEPEVRGAWIFGSVALGTDDAHSDLDLVVDLVLPNLHTLRSVQRRLEAKLNRAVDLYSLKDLQANPDVLLPLLEVARPVIDRVGWWHSLGRHKRALRARQQRLVKRRPAWAIQK